MTNPEMMHLISEIPEPAACLAKDWTRRAATKDNVAFWSISSARIHPRKRKDGVVCGSVEREGKRGRNIAAPQTARI
jgi:hypothetical protein